MPAPGLETSHPHASQPTTEPVKAAPPAGPVKTKKEEVAVLPECYAD
jgi:hypothetical protein